LNDPNTRTRHSKKEAPAAGKWKTKRKEAERKEEEKEVKEGESCQVNGEIHQTQIQMIKDKMSEHTMAGKNTGRSEKEIQQALYSKVKAKRYNRYQCTAKKIENENELEPTADRTNNIE